MSATAAYISSPSGRAPLTSATLALTWILSSLAVIAVVLRFHLRKKLGRQWVLHDWIMLAALACQLVYQAGITKLCQIDSGKPTDDLSPGQIADINKWSWIFAPFTHPTSILARVSIAIVLAQLFGTKLWFRWYVIIFTSILTALGCATFITNVAQAQPYAGLWDETIPGLKLWNPQIYHWTAVVLQIFYVVWDFTFVLFPVMILWKLNMRRRQKVGLMLLIASMLIVMAAATSKMIISMIFTVGKTTSLDPYLFQHAIDFSTCIEQALVIIMGCVPILHSIHKISLPSMKYISGSFGTIVSEVRNKVSHGRLRSSYQGHEHLSTENLELTPRIYVSDHKEAANKAKIIADLDDPNGNDTQAINGLRRTDSFTVSYHDRVRQGEEV